MRIGIGKGILALAAVALTAAVGAPEARAQHLTQIAQVESQGGFVVSSDKATFWADTNAIGHVNGGWIQVVRTYHGGNGGSILMHGKMDRSETLALWNAIYAAAPWRAKDTVQSSTNPDFPDTVVTYLAKYTQRIHGGPTTTRLALESAAMIQFVDQAWGFAQRTGAADLFVYHAAGGRSGYSRDITISRSGAISDVVDYASAAFAGSAYQKQGQLTAQQVNDLIAACAYWSRYPKAFPGNPQMVDLIGITVAFTSGTIVKPVFCGDSSNWPASFAAVIKMVEDLGNQIP